MRNDRLYKQLDKYNKRRFDRIYKQIKNELSNIPPNQYKVIDKKRDEVICYNLTLLLTHGDIKI